MEPLNEQLLTAWLQMSTAVVNSRVVSELSYKEALVCNVLYKNLQQQDRQPLTATGLCRLTNMLKSQMHRTLNALEEKGLVVRSRSQQDKRQVHIRFNPERAHAYEQQHHRILALVDGIIDRFGRGDAQQAVAVLSRLATAAGAQLREG